jgi:hypothetical protein
MIPGKPCCCEQLGMMRRDAVERGRVRQPRHPPAAGPADRTGDECDRITGARQAAINSLVGEVSIFSVILPTVSHRLPYAKGNAALK